MAAKNSDLYSTLPLLTNLELEARESQKEHSDEKEDASSRSELIHHGPEQLAGDAERAPPGGKFVDLIPVDILAIEAVGGAGVSGELRPKVVDVTAFADALPKVTRAPEARRTLGRRCGAGRDGSAHRLSV